MASLPFHKAFCISGILHIIFDSDHGIGADPGAIAARDAFGLVADAGGMIAFDICTGLIHPQDMLGTDADTQAAALAAVLVKTDACLH
jgi:hypothetical protein